MEREVPDGRPGAAGAGADMAESAVTASAAAAEPFWKPRKWAGRVWLRLIRRAGDAGGLPDSFSQGSAAVRRAAEANRRAVERRLRRTFLPRALRAVLMALQPHFEGAHVPPKVRMRSNNYDYDDLEQ
jgi:hypothetical protein